MIRITVTEPTDAGWQQWRQDCHAEIVLLLPAMKAWQNKWAAIPEPLDKDNQKLKNKEKPGIKGDLYKGRKKEFYFTDTITPPFYGKCAYCEADIYSNQHGDVEHYRPKGAVKDRQTGKPARIVIDGVEQDHPGYYWLAYEWTNLLPSCQLCNQSSSTRSADTIGKLDYFPLATAVRATQPGEETQEEPLLINPLATDPAAHLTLDRSGILAHRTEAGRVTIALLGLNERDLPGKRKKVYEDTKRLATDFVTEVLRDPANPRTQELLGQLLRSKAGAEPYTLAARLALAESLTPLLPLLQPLLA